MVTCCLHTRPEMICPTDMNSTLEDNTAETKLAFKSKHQKVVVNSVESGMQSDQAAETLPLSAARSRSL